MAGVEVEGLAVLQLNHLQIVQHLGRQTILCPIPICRQHTDQCLSKCQENAAYQGQPFLCITLASRRQDTGQGV